MVIAAGLACLAMAALAWVTLSAAGSMEPAGELVVRRGVKAEVRALFAARDYGALEAIAGRYRSGKDRTPSGIWKLTLFYGALHDAIATVRASDRGGWRALAADMGTWRKRYPASPTAIVAGGLLLKRMAWNLRPTGIVLEAALSTDRRFLDGLRTARRFLDANEAIAGSDPHFYVVWASLAAALGEDNGEFISRLQQAAAREPGYYQLYFAALDQFAPADGQSASDQAQAVEALANLAVERTRTAEGHGVYARIYWYASTAFWKDRLFAASHLDWARMQVGIDDVLARYPDAWNLNNFARLACLKGDRGKTAELFARMHGELALEAWPSRAEAERCHDLANGKG